MPSRRRLLAGVSGMTGIITLAGCSDSIPSSDDSETNNQTTSEVNETPNNSGSADIQLAEMSVPERVKQPGATITLTATFENTGDGSGTWEGVAILVDSRGEGNASIEDIELQVNIDAGERKKIERKFSVVDSGIVNFMLTGESGSGSESAVQRVAVVPSDPSPKIQITNLVSDWEQFGDAEDNVIDVIEPEAEATVATRYLYWTETGVLDARFEYRLIDENNNQLDVLADGSNRLTESEGWTQWERSYSFVAPSEPGNYIAEVLIRDRKDEVTSDLGRVQFRVET